MEVQLFGLAKRSGCSGFVGLTVYPGKSVIEAKVRLSNPTSLRQSYQMWATAAVNANENYQAIYPSRVMTGHGKLEFWKWPIDKKIDISWWKNIPNASSFFTIEPGHYFGGYDHGKNAGTVITGNPRIVIGKKLWTWGTSPFGRMWEPILTEDQGPYFEPQAGAYSDNLAADMGGMGFIERFRIECLRSILINTHMIEAAYQAGAQRYFFSSSACAYNTDLQKDPNVRALKESDAYPAMAERGYGWEKLMSEMFCEEYWHERGMHTAIARFHNVYGPNGTWDGGREKAPAAICRKVIEAKESGAGVLEIWGSGEQTRSFMYIDDCTVGIDLIMHSRDLVATPINLGSSELVSINLLADLAEEIGGIKLERRHKLDAPLGVAGRNSDNSMIKQILDWEPDTSLRDGLTETYVWIEQQFQDRKAGKRTVI